VFTRKRYKNFILSHIILFWSLYHTYTICS